LKVKSAKLKVCEKPTV